MFITELFNPDDAVDRLMEMMIEEKANPNHISVYIDAMMSRI